jgi:hypothetical protein
LASDVEYLFLCLPATYYFSLVKHLVKCFMNFCVGMFHFLQCFESSLYNLGTHF